MMDKIFIAFCISDVDYQQAVMAYLRDSEYANRLVIHFFSSKEKLLELLASGDPVHLIIAVKELMPDPAALNNQYALIALAEEAGEEGDLAVLPIYQPLNRLFAQAMEGYARFNPSAARKFKRDRKTQIVSVYSSSGGSGKTSVALAAAHQLGVRDYQVLYLNMEAVGGNPLQPQGQQEDGISNLLYYMRNNAKQLGARFETIKKRNEPLKIDYIFGPANIRDLLEINEADTRKLLQSLAGLGLYDMIVVDMDCSVQERNLGILQESDCVYWIMQSGSQCRRKTDETLKFLQKSNLNERQFFDQLYFVMNKQLAAAAQAKEDAEVIVNLPYIPEWKLSAQIEQVVANRHFNQFILKLLVGSKLLKL